jgi:hypothetical protein
MLDNLPPGAANDPNAPYNEIVVPDMEFDVTISMSLSKTVTCMTNKYNPVVIDEPHNRIHEEYPDTSDTPWSEVYSDNHKTIIELLEELKKYVQKDLDNLDNDDTKMDKAFHKRRLEWLLEECDNWVVNEEDYEGE